MTRQARYFLCAVQFLTRIPVPALDGFEPAWIARSAPYYPVVGWIVGASSACVLLAARPWSPAVAALLALATGFLVTGGFHEDGLADTADGFGGGGTPLRRLDIMKDSRIGTYGALALFAALALRAAALASAAPLRAAIALVVAHGAARAFSAIVMVALRYAGDPEAAKLKPVPDGVNVREAAVAALLGFAPLACVAPANAVLGFGLAAGGVATLVWIAKRAIGGWTGDVLGAAEQIAETLLLLGFVAALSYGS